MNQLTNRTLALAGVLALVLGAWLATDTARAEDVTTLDAALTIGCQARGAEVITCKGAEMAIGMRMGAMIKSFTPADFALIKEQCTPGAVPIIAGTNPPRAMISDVADCLVRVTGKPLPEQGMFSLSAN